MTALSFDILGRDKASKEFDKVSKAADRTEKKFGFLSARSHGLTAGIAAGFGKILPAMAAIAGVSVFKGFIDEARESRKVGALTESIIKSTGGAAKISANQVGALATAISNKTGIDDEAIQSGSNLLLTFKNVRNEVGKGANVFDRATQAAVDLSAAGFGDVNSASKMLGKALNDPLKGLTALGKAGVTFTADQQKQIKKLTETGDILSAQKIILKEVESQVGGAAAASADPIQKLGVILGNLKETFGTALLPIVDKAATWLGKVLPAAVATGGKFFNDKLLPPLKAVTDFVTGKVVPGFMGLWNLLVKHDFSKEFRKAFHVEEDSGIVSFLLSINEGVSNAATNAKKWASAIIDGLTAGFKTGDWKPLGKTLGDGVIAGLKGLGTARGKILDAFSALIDKVDWGKLGTKISGGIRGFISGVDWKALGDALGDGIINLFKKATDLSAKIGVAFKELMGKIDWQQIGRDSTDAIGKFASGVDWGAVLKTVASGLLKSFKANGQINEAILKAATGLAAGITSRVNLAIAKAFSGAAGWLVQKGKDLISGLTSGASSQASGIGSWISQRVLTPVVGAFKGAGKWLVQHGRDLITGLKDGVWSFAQGLDDWMVRAPVAKLLAPWYGAIRWLIGPGKDFIAGLLNGVASAAKSISAWLGKNVISPTVRAFGKAGTWLVQHGRNLITGLQNGIVAIARTISGWLSRNVITPVVSAFRTAGTWLVQQGRNVVAGFKNGVVAIARTIGRWAYDNVILPIVRPFGKAAGWLNRAGRDLIGGLTGGITGRMKGIRTWVKSSIVDPMVKAVKDFFGIKSPSKVFQGIGGHLIGGLLKGMGSKMGSAVAKKVFGDMPSALSGIVSKGLVSLANLPKKALDALFGPSMLNLPPGVAAGVLGGPNRRVFYDGEAFDLVTYQKLAKAMKMVGSINVTQGGYESASSYSGTTHTGGGVFDVVGGNLTRILNALKASGLIGWIRNPSQGNWPWHIHALDPSDTGRMSSSARGQVADYFRGGDGLGGYKLGTPWVPNDQLALLHKGEAVVPRRVNERRLQMGRLPRGGGAQRVVLEFRSDGSPHMDWLMNEFRRYVRVNYGGDVQKAFRRG